VLLKRAEYRKAFDRFDPRKVAFYTKRDVARLLRNEGLIRNRLKIESAVTNAAAFLDVKSEFGRFDRYIWGFVGGEPRVERRRRMADVPAITDQAEAMSKDLKRRGFRFVGPTICYAFMQATGMVNDHLTSCFRWRELGGR